MGHLGWLQQLPSLLLLLLIPLAHGCTGKSAAPWRASGQKQAEEHEQLPTLKSLGFKKLHFSITPYLPRPVMEEQFAPLIKQMEHDFHIPVKFLVADSYQQLMDLLGTGQIDIGSLSPLIYVLAKKKYPGIIPLATQIVNGTTRYSSYLMVQQDSGIHTLKGLKNKTMAFVNRSSASGYLLPYFTLLEKSLNPKTLFQKIIYSGNHINSIKLLEKGQADVIATFSGALKTARGNGIKTGSFRILIKTGRVPNDIVCARKNIGAKAAQVVKRFFKHLSTKTGLGRRILSQDLRINGWVEAQDSDYDILRKVLRSVKRSLRK